MKLLLAILVGKVIAKITKALKIGGGTAAPGLYALKIEPNLVEKLVRKIPKNVVITGTNGKTTTARMLAHFANEAGIKVIRNHTGSNLERGIASTLISSISLGSNLLNPGGWIRSNLGIWELDEAAFNTIAPKIKPDIVVFLNVFRDQLDRYGEVDSVVKRWCATLKSLPLQTEVLLNGDDINTAKLGKCFKGKVITFGVKDYKLVGESLEKKGSSKKLDYEAKNVKLKGLSGSTFSLLTSDFSLPVTLPLPGIYHIYDTLAAILCGYHLQIPPDLMVKSLKTYSPAFGRVEKFTFKPQGLNRHEPRDLKLKMGYIFLVKNPAGATQVFETIAPQIKPQDRLLLALNDKIADGTDVSWIWDANFEVLRNSSRALRLHSGSRDYTIFASGTRAYDLANRLKYAGFSLNTSNIEPDLKKALDKARKGLKGRLFILPTYTAMLKLQRILARSGIKKHYWEEDL